MLHDPHDAVAVANAVLRCKRGDALGSATGLCLFASVLAEDDQVARAVVALTMLQLALELCPDLAVALRWH
jgi:hypothetical protein